jgi:tetratricopeptide (TPR) repeat protein
MNESRRAKADDAKASPVLQVIVSLASSGESERAMARIREIADKDVAIEAWRRLSAVNANLQRWSEAFSAIENALLLAPGSRQLRLDRASLFAQHGDDAVALAEFESLARESSDSPGLFVHLATLLAAAGRVDEAEAQLLRALELWPVDAPVHAQLARLRWQRGDGLLATHHVSEAIQRYPRELHLRLVAADLLRSVGATDEALALLERGLELAPDSPVFRTSIGVLLEGADRLEAALAQLREAFRLAPRSVPVRRNLVPALLRSGAVAEARDLLDGLLAQFPDDQLLIAQRATALRLLGDAEYHRLYDYARVVKSFALRPAAPYTNLAEFNAAFARELTPLHRGARHPLEQSLRGGSQTERHLPRDNPVIAAFFSMVDAPIREYIGALRHAEATHPLDRRKGANYRISGSWSVQLRPGGFHTNHVHPRGWLSSAYYVELPEVTNAQERAGWLKFGEPGIRIEGCGAEHFVRPAPGMLVLFPSYLWHGTVPFGTGDRRLTAAFDVLPA